MDAQTEPTSTLPPPSVAPVVSAARVPAPGEWRVWSLVMLALLAFYGLLWNPHWVPGGDSDFYIATARNIALGRGYTFNGTPVGIAPIGWPLVMAGAMKISPQFGFLKLVTLLSMTGFLGVSYWILRRFVSVRRAAMIVLFAGCISHLYSLTFWLHSDALFALLCAGAVLLALQINEGRSLAWRLPVLLALCAASVAVRWIGVINWLLVAGALMEGCALWERGTGRRKPQARGFPVVVAENGDSKTEDVAPNSSDAAFGEPRPARISPPVSDRRWITMVLAGLVTVGSFWVVRGNSHASQGDNDTLNAAVADDSATYDIIPSSRNARKKNKVQAATKQILSGGRYFSWLFWQPLRFGSASAPLDVFAGILGWLLAGIFLFAAIVRGRRRQWFWPGVCLYCLALCIGWPHPNARYLVPLAPFILMGVSDGFLWLAPETAGPRRRRWIKNLNLVFLGSIVLCNVGLWAIDVWVARSSDFYARYEGGLNQDLIAAGHYFSELHLRRGEIGVSEKYANLNHWRASHYGLRVMVLLTGEKIRDVDMRHSVEPGIADDDDRKVLRLHSRGVRYYLYQPPVNPWRVWHFRVPAWLQERLLRNIPHEPITGDTAGWQLWELSADPPESPDAPIPPGALKRLQIPRVPNWPDRVPGM